MIVWKIRNAKSRIAITIFKQGLIFTNVSCDCAWILQG